MTIDFRNGDEMVIKNKLRISYSYNSQLFIYKLAHTFSHIFSHIFSYIFSYIFILLVVYLLIYLLKPCFIVLINFCIK